MEAFIAALRDRGIPNENLQTMIQDKVDEDVVKLMDEGALSRYIPHFGDRVFARNWSASSLAAGSNEEKKKQLIERIRSKMKLPSSSTATTSTQNRQLYLIGNKNAERKTRKIELGWMNYHNGHFKQVRRQTGGGTREIIVKKDDSVLKILEDAKKIFFPNGKSTKGIAEHFHFTLCVMGSEEPLDGMLTVGNLYDMTHHKLLRLYMFSKKKQIDCSDSNDYSKQDKGPESFQTAEPPSSPEHSFISYSNTLSPQGSSISGTLDRPLSSSSPLMCSGVSVISKSTTSSLTSDPSVPQVLGSSTDDEVIFLNDNGKISLDVLCDTLIYQPVHGPEQQVLNCAVEVIQNVDDQMEEYAIQQTYSNHVQDSKIQQVIEIDQVYVTEETSSSSEHTNSQSCTSLENQPTQPEVINQETVSNFSSETSSSAPFYENPENIVEKQTITIRKVHCVSDMIQAFADENILDANITFVRMMDNGDFENGVGCGLVMDCLTDFWSTFYLSRTCGTTYKIPTLHHTYQEREWKAVARIVAFGWQRFKYLPIQLATPFLQEAFSLSSPTCHLMETFFNYISPTEKDVLTEALNDFMGADMQELLTILSSHNCTTLPTQQNLHTLLEEIAHKELVQEPSFIIKCWKPVLKGIGVSLGSEGLEKIIENLHPKPRNVTKLIHFPNSMSPAEKTTSHHLLRFIREMDQKDIGLFLRFCTGSDLFLSKTIQVTFTDMSEFSRRPVAHTCTCLLELACSYSTFSEFRSEFQSVLKSGIWVMDLS